MMKEITDALATDNMDIVKTYAKDYGIDIADIKELYEEYTKMIKMLSEMDINEFYVEFGDDIV